MSNYFNDLPTTNKRRNRFIFSSSDLKIVNLPALFEKTKFKPASSYVYPRTCLSWVFDHQFKQTACIAESTNITQTVFVVGDLDTEDGLALVREALISQVRPDIYNYKNIAYSGFPLQNSNSKTRLSILHNPATSHQQVNAPRSHAPWLIAHLHIRELLPRLTPSRLLVLLGFDSFASPEDAAQAHLSTDNAFSQEDDQKDYEQYIKLATRNLDLGPEQSMIDGGIRQLEYNDYIKRCKLFARELGLTPGQKAVIVNGRVSFFMETIF